MTTYNSAVLFCADVKRSETFYSGLFDLTIGLDLGGMISYREGISLWNAEMARDHAYAGANLSSGEKPGQELYFETDDIDGFVKKIPKDTKMLHQIQQAPWQQRVIRFFDPDGHLIEVGEKMEVVVRNLAKKGYTPEKIAEMTMMPGEFITMALQDRSGKA